MAAANASSAASDFLPRHQQFCHFIGGGGGDDDFIAKERVDLYEEHPTVFDPLTPLRTRFANPMTDNNPYLAHWSKAQRGADQAGGRASEPLFGFVPRNVDPEKVQKAMVSQSNW